MILLRTVPHNPLKDNEREALRFYRSERINDKSITKGIIGLYYENLEHKVRMHELLLSLDTLPFSRDSVHSYKHDAHLGLHRLVKRGWLSRYILAWAAIVVGSGSAILGLVSFFVSVVVPPLVWLILAAIGIGYGAIKCWLRDYELNQTYQQRWVKHSYDTYESTLPLEFISIAECIRVCEPSAYIMVEELGQGQFLLLTVEWGRNRYRLAEWHSR